MLLSGEPSNEKTRCPGVCSKQLATREEEAGDSPGAVELTIAGGTTYERNWNSMGISPNTRIILEKEDDNPYDSVTVKVLTAAEHSVTGYIRRDNMSVVRELMDRPMTN